MQNWFSIQKSINVSYHDNFLKKKNHSQISRCIWQNTTYFHDLTTTKKALSKLKGNFLNLIKDSYRVYHYQTLNAKTEGFPLRSGIGQEDITLPTILSNILMEDLATAERYEWPDTSGRNQTAIH